MSTEHTVGPWETSRDAVPKGHVQITIYAEATGERVAIAFEREANADLIATAPDLLAALERIAAADDNHDITPTRDELKQWARTAIAKARGEAS